MLACEHARKSIPDPLDSLPLDDALQTIRTFLNDALSLAAPAFERTTIDRPLRHCATTPSIAFTDSLPPQSHDSKCPNSRVSCPEKGVAVGWGKVMN